MRICGDLQDFGRGFMRICETLGEDSQGCEDLPRIHFGRGFVRIHARIHKTLGEDSFKTLGERIHGDS